MLGIERECPVCLKLFHYCQHCWRGHKYCSPACSHEGRKKSRRASDKKYTATAKGRENRRVRQKNYRIRKILGTNVTDHPSTKVHIKLKHTTMLLNKRINRCCRCWQLIKVVKSSRGSNKPLTDEMANYFSFSRFGPKT